jgi:hypothetical protein
MLVLQAIESHANLFQGALLVIIVTGKSALPLAAMMAAVVSLCVSAGCQATKPAAGPAIALKAYTASDQSASAGVPAGWTVTKGAGTVIVMTGPDGVTVSLGNTVVAQNAAFQANTHLATGVDLTMPYTATLAQKLTMIFDQNAAVANKAAPKVTIDSATAMQLPAAVGQCARIVADVSGAQGAMKVMAVYCSLPVDSGGTYKNIMLLAQAPAAVAAQAAPTAQAIFQSYRIPSAWLQKKLAPFAQPPATKASATATAAEIAAIQKETMASQAAVSNSANCFDLSVLRETPTYQLPRSCGGMAPN